MAQGGFSHCPCAVIPDLPLWTSGSHVCLSQLGSPEADPEMRSQVQVVFWEVSAGSSGRGEEM